MRARLLQGGIASVSLLVAGIQACALPLDELAPFACAQDGTCPDGYYCVDVGCVPPSELDEHTPFPCGDDGTCPTDLFCVPDVGCVTSAEAGAFAPFACTNGCPSGMGCVSDVGCVVADECDLFEQNCPTERPKCSVVLFEGLDFGSETAQCLPQTGDDLEGAPCDREDLGRDSCDRGLFCGSAHTPDGSFVCREYCSAKQPCDGDHGCTWAFRDAEVGIGLCVDTCLPSADPCGSGRSCKGQFAPDGYPGGEYFASCFDDGTVIDGESCESTADCGPGLSCFGVCRRLCDMISGCGPEATCELVFGTELGSCSCHLFGDYCGAGRTCGVEGTEAEGVIQDCRAAGSQGPNQSCDQHPCIEGYNCWGSDENGHFCTPLCDFSHPCPDGSPCQQLMGTLDGGGVCDGF